MDLHDLSQRRGRLSSAKQALLNELMQGKAAPSFQPFPEHSNVGHTPLSSSQERLWFLEQLAPGSTAYNLPALLRLSGPLAVEVLERSLNEIVRRHGALRTTFTTIDGQPMQVVSPTQQITLAVQDISSLPEKARELQLRAYLNEGISQLFQLTSAPLLRGMLLRLGEHEHRLLLVLHHIIADAWSLRIVIQELAVIYSAFVSGQSSPLQDAPLQFADYIVWQRQQTPGLQREAQIAHWKETLHHPLPTLQLPLDRQRPSVQTYAGTWYNRHLPPSLLAELETYGRQQHATPYMVLLAAFNTLLYRYTGMTDILVGTPVANRSRPELEGIIGFFANTLVLRTDLSGNPTFTDLLKRVRETALGAFSHAAIAFEKVVEIVRPERNVSYSPLFQVMFLFQGITQPPLHAGELVIEVENIEDTAAQFDLTLAIAGALSRFQYNTDLFNATTVERMAACFERLLTSIVADPNQRIAQLPMVSEDERHLMVVTWNRTQQVSTREACVHELFECQVERTPEAIALVAGDAQLSYRELEWRANQLALYLQSLGVSPEARIGICLERSIEAVVAILGILKAGGAYTPLDPRIPKQRLTWMLESARVEIVLTQQRFVTQLDRTDRQIICLDSTWHPGHTRAESVKRLVTPDNLMYVMYTSGSTGQPKGVMNVHRSIGNVLQWLQSAYPLNETDRVLHTAPMSFDISVGQIFWPLVTGACLILAQPEGDKDPGYLVRVIREQQVTALQFVPSMLNSFLQEPGVEDCLPLRYVFSTGEALPYNVQKRFFERSVAELHNLYGPTEAAIWATFWACRSSEGQRSIVPIGKPIANTRIAILNEQYALVPIGVPGDLYISGIGLARGYINRPDLTAERFLPNPFSDHPGSRMYRTGDRACYLADGSIEYLGRVDRQVKLRGFRIELAEIALMLEHYTDIRECIVLMHENEQGNQRLVAYLVAQAKQRLEADQLRAFLRERLPEYMIPSAFVQVDAFPLLTNGKVDYQSLSTLQTSQLQTVTSYTMPRTDLERTLVDMWQNLLQRERIGLHDNFFDLGGHSLLMVQVRNALINLLGRSIPLIEFFQYPTIGTLAAYLSASQQVQTTVGMEQIRAQASRQKQAIRQLGKARNAHDH